MRAAGLVALRVLTPVASVLLLWYLAIWFSGLPAFVIPRPERVAEGLLPRLLLGTVPDSAPVRSKQNAPWRSRLTFFPRGPREQICLLLRQRHR